MTDEQLLEEIRRHVKPDEVFTRLSLAKMLKVSHIEIPRRQLERMDENDLISCCDGGYMRYYDPPPFELRRLDHASIRVGLAVYHPLEPNDEWKYGHDLGVVLRWSGNVVTFVVSGNNSMEDVISTLWTPVGVLA